VDPNTTSAMREEDSGWRRFSSVALFLRSLTLAATMLWLAPPGFSQGGCTNCPDGGTWNGPFDLDARLSDVEFAHAALIPTGTHAGKVLMWEGTRAWLYAPENPGQLIRVQDRRILSSTAVGVPGTPRGITWWRAG